MARSGPVKTAAQAAPKYQAGVSGGGAAWNSGIQACTDNPMQLASQQAPKAIQHYTEALGPNGHWVNLMASMPVQSWKAGAQAKQAKYSGSAATAAAAWSAWYTRVGMATAATVRNTAQAGRANGVPGVDRAVIAINQMAASATRRH